MKGIFAYDGPFITFMTKVGEILLLDLITLLCCIPIVTIGPALISLYYAMIKGVIHDRGNLLQEYWKSFKRVFVKGLIATVIFIAWFAVLIYGRQTAVLNYEANPSQGLKLLRIAYDVLIALGTMIAIYLFPVMSRYENKLINLFKLSFVMSIRYIYFTVLFLAVLGLAGYLIIFKIPVLWGLLFPGFLCYGECFLMEKPLLKYMPPVPEGTDDWYHERLIRKKDGSED